MNYKVKVVREAGPDPLTGYFLEYAEQHFEVEADNPQAAHRLADRLCSLPFRGQLRRTFINGEEHLNEKY